MKCFSKSIFRIILSIVLLMLSGSCDNNDTTSGIPSPFGPKTIKKVKITYDYKIDTEIEVPENIKKSVSADLNASTTDFETPVHPEGKVMYLEFCEMPVEIRDTELKNGVLSTTYGDIDVLLVGLKGGESIFELHTTEKQLGHITKDVIKYQDNKRNLFNAVLDNDIPKLKSLTDAKVELNVRSVDDITPLMAATIMNQPEVVRILLDAGADVNAKDRMGWTALIHSASANNNIEIAETLINARSDINARGTHGNTALIMATLKGNMAFVKALVEAGADLNVSADTEGKGSTALSIAEKKAYMDIAEFLKESGAK